MTKISKKIYLSFLLLLCMFSVSCSCLDNNYETYPNGIDITVSEELKEHFLHPELLPSLHFDYNGVNALKDSGGSAYFFVQNDQYELSNKFASHLSRYNDDEKIIVSSYEQTMDYGTAHFVTDTYLLDPVDEFGNEQLCSMEYQLVCTDTDGTRYSYQYRTFVTGGIRYYIYRYSSNIGISMEQPLMVVDTSEGRKLVLLPLPYDTKYEVSGASTKINQLLKNDEFLEERYYKFAYPAYLNEYGEELTIEYLKNWYKKYCTVDESGSDFLVTYLGNTFKVTFSENNCGASLKELGFKLEYVK